jgi:Tfp pilus assembly protein PilN
VSQVNLLPPEYRQRQAVRRTTSIVVLAAIGAMVIVGLFYFLQLQRLSSARSELAAQQERNAALQTQIQDLQQYADLRAELEAKQQLLADLYVNEVSWSAVLLDVSRIIPDASYLTSLSGQVQAASQPDAAAPEQAGLIGSMTFSGVARETSTIATWITRVEQVRGWANAWVSSAQETGPRTQIYNFSSGLDLTSEAITERGRGVVP